MSKHTVFRAYRYQLLPIDRNETKDLYDDYSAQELIERKNDFFSRALLDLRYTPQRRGTIQVQVREMQQEMFRLWIAPSRELVTETREATKIKVENWPHIEAYILNSPDSQLLIIQDRPTAFENTDTVAKIIYRGTREQLNKIGLSLHIEPLFDKTYFWNLVNNYKNKITWLEFEFITPNMANISKPLAEALKILGKETNAVKEKLALSSDPGSSLDISPKNATVKGLVEYTSEGGGEIKIKVKGIRKRFHTSSSFREVYLSGIEISGDAKYLKQAIMDALK